MNDGQHEGMAIVDWILIDMLKEYLPLNKLLQFAICLACLTTSYLPNYVAKFSLVDCSQFTMPIYLIPSRSFAVRLLRRSRADFVRMI